MGSNAYLPASQKHDKKWKVENIMCLGRLSIVGHLICVCAVSYIRINDVIWRELEVTPVASD